MLLRIVFIVFSAMVLGFAVLVVTARKMFDAALFLAGSLFGVAVLYILLEAEFLAVAQVMIYVGAIATLIVFAIMLSRNMMRGEIRAANEQWLSALLAAVLLFSMLVLVLIRSDWSKTVAAMPALATPVLAATGAVEGIGRALVGDYVLPFEVASVLLLVGMVGAIIIGRDREK